MKKYVFLIAMLILVIGCGQQKKEPLQINSYGISKDEFNAEFKNSAYGRTNTLESRKEFLDNLIDRKLILQDAQANGLDKDPAFLKMIERFWEQSLLKLAVDAKSKEIAASVLVSDTDVEARYNQLQQEGKAERPYEQMYRQIKWDLTKDKETKAMNDWIFQLRTKAQIRIDEQLVSKDK